MIAEGRLILLLGECLQPLGPSKVSLCVPFIQFAEVFRKQAIDPLGTAGRCAGTQSSHDQLLASLVQ